MALTSLARGAIYAFIMPCTNWRARFEGIITPYFPGIKYDRIDISHDESSGATYVRQNALLQATYENDQKAAALQRERLQKLECGSEEVFSAKGCSIRHRYLNDNPGKKREQTYIIFINRAVSVAASSALVGAAAYKVQTHIWKISTGLKNKKAGMIAGLVASFLSGSLCWYFEFAKGYIEKGFALCLESSESFKRYKEVEYNIDAETIIEGYYEHDKILSSLSVCSYTLERIVRATYDHQGNLVELDQLKIHSPEIPSDQVRECYATTLVLHRRIEFLCRQVLASFKISETTKKGADFLGKMEWSKQIADEACKLGENDIRWIGRLCWKGKISIQEDETARQQTKKIYKLTDFSKDEAWKNDWKGELSKRFQELFYQYPQRAIIDSIK